MDPVALTDAVADLPAGAWGVAVSGGADSVALLRLAHRRADLSLHVIHLDHQTRSGQSTADAHFVAALAAALHVPATLACRSDMEPLLQNPPANLSARFRALRLALYERVAAENHLSGILLAHHADDQAETILHRLLRGGGIAGLAGMRRATRVGGAVLVRPLLSIRRTQLRDYLQSIGQPWREDASNRSELYLRNRLRKVLAEEPGLTMALLELGEASAALRDWTRSSAPILDDAFAADALADLPLILAEESARRWLQSHGAPSEQILPPVIGRLMKMAADAATPPKVQFPGNLTVRRKRGVLSANPPR